MLALAVVLLYCSECAALVPGGSAGFRRAWLRGWAVAEPWDLFGGLRWALLVGNPLPPMGFSIACRPHEGNPGSLEARTFKTAVEELTTAARPLLIACNLLWAYLFIGLPVAFAETSLIVTWPYLVAGLFALTFLCSFLYARAHRELDPNLGSAPFQHIATVALVPMTAIRAVDLLTKELGSGLHPLAAAQALLPREAFIGYARRFHFDAMHRDPAAKAVPSPWFDESRRQAIESFLAANGAAPDELLLAPVKTDDTSKTYCPRCHAQFTVAEGTCRDCGGIALAAF